MSKYTNDTGISLPLAVWLATDNYDGKQKSNPYQISATSLLKSIRQIILGMRAKPEDEVIDVASIVKSRIGTALHDAIENSWKSGRLHETIESLGYPKELADRVIINPDKYVFANGTPPLDMIPVYMEQRAYKSVGKWLLTGKFDFIFHGHLHDYKSTSTFVYSNAVKSDDYIKQGSIYRWLNPDKIDKDKMTIDFIFTDWKSSGLNQANYPPSQVLSQQYDLIPIAETHAWVEKRLALIESHENTEEADLPLCNDNELWRSESVWKYYSSGQVAARSTKNFDTAAEAYARKNTDGNKGLVLEVKGAPTACLYCNVASSCSQRSMFVANGDLNI